jgi:hypothetical protein
MSIEELLASANPYAADQIAWELEMEIDRFERSLNSENWRDVDRTRELISKQIADLIRLASGNSRQNMPLDNLPFYDPAQMNLL